MRKRDIRRKDSAGRGVTLPVLIEQDERGMYVGIVPSLRSCYTQGATLEELYTNLKEAVALALSIERDYFKGGSKINRIIGFQNMEFALR